MTNTVVCIGDSLTFGSNATGTLTKNLVTRLSEKYPMINYANMGVPGDTTVGLLSRWTGARFYTPFRVIVWIGVNDVAIGWTYADIKARIETIFSNFAGDGFEVWACTITPVDTNSAAMNTVRDSLNTWLRTVPTNVDRVIDTWTIIRDPSDPTRRLPAYCDVASIVHLNDAAYTAIVAAFPNL
jgi:lysophospholipase L1-like esterase